MRERVRGQKKVRQSHGHCISVGEEVVRVICAYALRSGKPDAQKDRFYEEMARKWSM